MGTYRHAEQNRGQKKNCATFLQNTNNIMYRDGESYRY